MGLDSDGRCPYKRKAEGDWRHTEMLGETAAKEHVAARLSATFVKDFRGVKVRSMFFMRCMGRPTVWL